jgi:hypothetical protein
MDRLVLREIEHYISQNKNVSNNAALKQFEADLANKIRASHGQKGEVASPMIQSVDLPKIVSSFNQAEKLAEIVKSQDRSRHKMHISLDANKRSEPNLVGKSFNQGLRSSGDFNELKFANSYRTSSKKMPSKYNTGDDDMVVVDKS